MNDRIPLDHLTSDQLDQLYADLDRYEEVQGEMNERAIDLTRRAARAEAELKRLRASEEDGYDPRCLPTPGQWIKNYNDATAESRQAIVTRLTGAAEQGHACAMGLHEERIQEGREAAAAIARVRALAEQWQASVRPGEPNPGAYAILAALDQPAPAPADARPDPACVIAGTCTHCGQPARAATTWSHVPIRSDCQDPAATFQPGPAAPQATEPVHCPCNGVHFPSSDTCRWCKCHRAPQPIAGQPEPATITDPEWLRHLYAAAIRRWWDAHDGGAEEIADAVMRVRDRHLDQLRQRLHLADQAHRQEQQRADQAEDLLRIAHDTSNKSEAERARFARIADDRADTIAELRADRARLRTRLAEQETETMRQHERAKDAEDAIARVRALRDDLRGITGARYIADALDNILDREQPTPAATQATEPGHNDGPTVAECVEADRRWPLEKHGE